MNWLMRFFKSRPLPAPAFDPRGWQLVDFPTRFSNFKH